MSGRFRGIPEQATRLGAVLTLLVVGVFVARAVFPSAFVPAAVHQRATAEREAARPVKYAGAVACKECHEDESKEKLTGNHRDLSCETCHGPSQAHVTEAMAQPVELKPYAPRERDFCPRCHAYDRSRPTGFAQINPTTHYPQKPCYTCHKPHAPATKEAPQGCSACHAEIARTLAVSSHVLLECKTCHTVPDEHLTQPKKARPTKPETREFCGKCHARGSENKEAPKIDLLAHEEKYPCWQCHYPHLPEGRK